ncbi:MAG: YIP1 family protein [Nitrococcus sp.]|nr:YIP1 family protein [Nitrococcus sp.]
MATSFAQRMILAAKLDANVYEEVEADTSATGQAAAVVVIASIAAGIAAVAVAGLPGVIVVTIAALIGWLVWAVLIYLIGAKLLPQPQTRTNLGELLRTIGFASSPGVIRIGGIIPGIGFIFVIAGNIWMLVATVIAVRQALDYTETGRAVWVCFLTWLVQLAIILIAQWLTGSVGPQAAP